MPARMLMIQGTGSSVGKSLIATALCRLFARRGIRVAPFKAQNMSNNAAVCEDGGEIGRAQALQAAAAGVRPTTDMNPILLKPEADNRSQIVVNGRPWRSLEANPYYSVRDELWPQVTRALDRLREAYDLVVIEGAGSPAELNLHEVELVNMAVARYAQASVLLVGDIERGGVFAQLLGTLWLLPEQEQRLIRGLIVNKFRGDLSLFDAGVTALRERSGLPVLGVIPWRNDLHLPEEDALGLDERRQSAVRPGTIDIAVIRLPHIANFDDFAPLEQDPAVHVRYVASVGELSVPDVVILPGTKGTLPDLAWLRASGLATTILALARRGTCVVGICGGYQMLGQRIVDPERIESEIRESAGLGLLPTETSLHPEKRTCQARGVITEDRHCPGCLGEEVAGYEIHQGRTRGATGWLTLHSTEGAEPIADGAISADGRVWGTHLHGLFHSAAFRRGWLRTLREGLTPTPEADAPDHAHSMEQAIDAWADHLAAALDLDKLEEIVWN